MEDLENDVPQEEALQKKILEMEKIVKVFLTGEALERLNNLKIAHEEKYLKVLTLLYQLIATGQIRGKITSDLLKEILRKLSEKERKKTRIKIVRR